jgi:hypothetical protein
MLVNNNIKIRPDFEVFIAGDTDNLNTGYLSARYLSVGHKRGPCGSKGVSGTLTGVWVQAGRLTRRRLLYEL